MRAEVMEQQRNRSRGALARTILKIATIGGISCLALGVVNPTLIFADAQNDFDADGISDITYTSSSTTALHWNSVATSDATKQV